MPIIKLNATDSTNAYLKELVLTQTLKDLTVVSATVQLEGRGQMGAKWLSESGKNLTISVLKLLNDFHVKSQFNLNCIVSLAIYDVLLELKVPNLSVKWPNDILSANKKICGILIENILKGKFISMAILGIGLNVNQTNFETLENASSIKQQLGVTTDINLDDLIYKILDKLKIYFELPEQDLQDKYQATLFRKDKPSTFSTAKGEQFSGFIRGVAQSGKLIVELEDQILKEYGFKEIKLLY